MEEKWVKLEVGNDWHTIYYTYPGESRNKAGSCTQEKALKLAEGQLLKVRFPDGHEETLTLVKNHRTGSTGHDTVTQTLFGVEVLVHDIRVWVHLADLEVVMGSLVRKKDE